VFESTVARGRVFTDETGISYVIPVLLTKDGPVEELVDYFVDHWDSRGTEWMVKAIRAVRLFLDYLDAHPGYTDEQAIFVNFRQRLLTGSISAGEDPSGLWWSARGADDSNVLIGHLTDFFNWWANKYPGKRNPADHWQGSRVDQQLAEVAYLFRRNKAFLGHTWNISRRASGTSSQNRAPRYRNRPPRVERETPRGFPENRILDLIFKGFKVGRRYNYRNMLITLLLNGAGFRMSEPFHLYLWDVMEDPSHKGRALVLIQHPSWGAAPLDPLWVNTDGKQRTGNRTEYLAERFGLAPRDWDLSTTASGWKGGMHETQYGGYYKQAYWFVPEFGDLFWDIWHLYVEEVQRIDPALRHHPFAFVNTARHPRGEPYKMGKFQVAHEEAVRRIGLVPSMSHGTHIHSHRHAYGTRLSKAGLSKEMIRRFMHHADIESQGVYTMEGHAECLEALAKGVDRLNTMSAELRDRIVNVNRDEVTRVLMPSTFQQY